MVTKVKQRIALLHGIASPRSLASLLHKAVLGAFRVSKESMTQCANALPVSAGIIVIKVSSPKADHLAKVSLVKEKHSSCSPHRPKKSHPSPMCQALFYQQMGVFFTRDFSRKV